MAEVIPAHEVITSQETLTRSQSCAHRGRMPYKPDRSIGRTDSLEYSVKSSAAPDSFHYGWTGTTTSRLKNTIRW
jgi:hypothetical protein